MKTIRFPLPLPGAMIADHHRVGDLTVRDGRVMVTLTSYPEDGAGVARFDVPIAASEHVMPFTALAADPDPYQAAALWLTGAGGPFPQAAVSEDLSSARAAAIVKIEAKRDAVISGGIETPFGRVQTDPTSLSLIEGVVSRALVAVATNQPLAVQWRLEDNSYSPTIDAAGVFAIKGAVDAHIAAAMARSWELKALATAEDATAATLAMLPLDQGWPSQDV